jgi:hypothetical protein
MRYMKAAIEILLEVDDNDEGQAADAISEAMRPLLREFAPGSSIIDWRYAGGVEGYAEPHDGAGFEYAT